MATRSGKSYRPSPEHRPAVHTQQMSQPELLAEFDPLSPTEQQIPTILPHDLPEEDCLSMASSSRHTQFSRGSSTGSAVAIIARAKAEATRVKLKFAHKQAELLKNKAQQESELIILNAEMEAAAADTEATILEDGAVDRLSLCESNLSAQRNLAPVENPRDRIENYVYKRYDPIDLSEIAPDDLQIDQKQRSQPVPVSSEAISGKHIDRPEMFSNAATLQRGCIDQFTNYMMKRELISSGLVQFDDKPANYRAWKASFKRVTDEICLTPAQELDLIIKWLSNESSTLVTPLRAINIHRPDIGLKMVWEELDKSYGSAEVVEHDMFSRLDNFPSFGIKEGHKLRQLGHLLLEVQCAKEEDRYPGLASLDSSYGVNPIVQKLPHSLQEKWMARGSQHKREKGVQFPPFYVFVEFVRGQADMRNDPSFITSMQGDIKKFQQTRKVSVQRTEIGNKTSELPNTPEIQMCTIHELKHPLRDCKAFRRKPIAERIEFLKKLGLCFKCCSFSNHLAKDCHRQIRCEECGSDRHISAMHAEKTTWQPQATQQDGGEPDHMELPQTQTVGVNNACTDVCRAIPGGKSCAKICKVVVYRKDKENEGVTLYAVIDDQSNSTLGKGELFDRLGITAPLTTYTMKTCAGSTQVTGRETSELWLKSTNGQVRVRVPCARECEAIPDNVEEIPTPEVARCYPHLCPIADHIEPYDPKVPILLLIGRDVLQVHKVREQLNGPSNAPFAQRLDLGWVIIGETCLHAVHRPKKHSVYRTTVTTSGRPSYFEPCPNAINVSKQKGEHSQHVFATSNDDEKQAFSIDDQRFLRIMQQQVCQSEGGSWIAPLPFRGPRKPLPNNKKMAKKRLDSLRKSLARKPVQQRQFIEFIQKMLDDGHAAPAPPIPEGSECWYLPMFPVYHPQKPNKIRVVFDSSAECEGVSLNKALLTGPDLNNSLIGVLLRFRREPIAIMADIQQMFYCFFVKEQHRDYLRFMWFLDNDTTKDIIDYRMNVHVFGNGPSPSVAIYCMRRAAEQGVNKYGQDACDFVIRDFYVDDGLTSLPSPLEAVDLLERTKNMLKESNMNLHKIASNSQEVMSAFDPEVRAKDLQELKFGSEPLPLQRTLGVSWDLKTDSFTFKISLVENDFTRRRMLSTVNSLYDPLGMASPVTLQGKLLVREATSNSADWDTPVSKNLESEWRKWKNTLQALESLKISRCYSGTSLSSAKRRELHVFSDASTEAIGSVAYLRVIDEQGRCHVGFVMAKSKLAPRPAHTIPRLELCAAVMSAEMCSLILDELVSAIDQVMFYTDSRVVLGYINNTSRRFHVYVANRVNRIRNSSHPEQWGYITTKNNPADLASRRTSAEDLRRSRWFQGPQFLHSEELSLHYEVYGLVEPHEDVEIRVDVTNMATKVLKQRLGVQRFVRFSNWYKLLRTIAKLKAAARRKKWNLFFDALTPQDVMDARNLVLKEVQLHAYQQEIVCLEGNRPLPRDSPIQKLSPVIGNDGLVRIGGRSSMSQDPYEQQHPIVLPAASYVTEMIVRYYHEQVIHQGRKITEGAVRAAGYWVVGGKRKASSVIHKCVTCKRSRGTVVHQKMADLPADRLQPSPPFTSVGLDMFGPWKVVSRRTRGGNAESKRWAVLFTCMTTRAVHIEVVESADSSSFINALRRFSAVRGPARVLRSDRGTNFVGGCNELNLQSENADVRAFLQTKGSQWVFNPPHASHMGGAWERMIGIARRILDAMLLQQHCARLTNEVLVTLMAEVMAIMNSRPLVDVSTDPSSPTLLTPAMLLRQKTDHVTAPNGNFQTRPMYTSQWKYVQSLANTFWKRWKRDYLSMLQARSKWQKDEPNVRVGDVVLVKDAQAHRNQWPIARIIRTDESLDGKVRKVELKIIKNGEARTLERPISELVMLVKDS